MLFKAEIIPTMLRVDVSDKGSPLDLSIARLSTHVRIALAPDQENCVTFEDAVSEEVSALLQFQEQYPPTWPPNEVDVKTLAHFFDSARSHARSSVARAVNTACWRLGEVLDTPAAIGRIAWSHNGESWHDFPPEAPGPFSIKFVRSWPTQEVAGKIEGIIQNAAFQLPVAYEMLGEAYRTLRSRTLRSAVMIAVGALEVAVKEHIAALVPAAEYLAFYAPTPPIEKLLSKYLPKLTELSPRPPKRLLNAILNGITLRNSIAHQGAASPSYSEVHSLLASITDAIWLLEWSRGFERAWYFISGATQHEFITEQFRDAARSALVDENVRKQLLTAAEHISRKDTKEKESREVVKGLYEQLPKCVQRYATYFMPAQ